MQKKTFFLFFLLILALFIFSCLSPSVISKLVPQGENQFPKLTGINLHKQIKNIPEDFAGEFNLVTVAFKQKQQEEVNTWINFFDEISPKYKHLRYYEIPFIYEVNQLKRTFIQSGMRGGIKEDRARERTVTVFTKREPFFKLMNMNEDNIYTLLLDKDANILWRTEGVTNKSNKQQLRNILQKL